MPIWFVRVKFCWCCIEHETHVSVYALKGDNCLVLLVMGIASAVMLTGLTVLLLAVWLLSSLLQVSVWDAGAVFECIPFFWEAHNVESFDRQILKSELFRLLWSFVMSNNILRFPEQWVFQLNLSSRHSVAWCLLDLVYYFSCPQLRRRECLRERGWRYCLLLLLHLLLLLLLLLLSRTLHCFCSGVICRADTTLTCLLVSVGPSGDACVGGGGRGRGCFLCPEY